MPTPTPTPVTEQGQDWRIMFGDGASTEVFVPIAGETSFDFNRNATEQDDSSKDDGAYGSTSYNRQKLTMKIAGNLKLPDAGFSRADAVAKQVPPEGNVKIMKGAIVKFHGRIAIGGFSAQFPKDGAATYSIDMANKGTPIVDNLGASS